MERDVIHRMGRRFKEVKDAGIVAEEFGISRSWVTISLRRERRYAKYLEYRGEGKAALLSAQKKKELVSCYKASGYSIKGLAKKFEISNEAVRRLLTRARVDIRVGRAVKLNKEIVCRLLAEGFNRKEVAIKLSYNKSSVYRLVAKWAKTDFNGFCKGCYSEWLFLQAMRFYVPPTCFGGRVKVRGTFDRALLEGKEKLVF